MIRTIHDNDVDDEFRVQRHKKAKLARDRESIRPSVSHCILKDITNRGSYQEALLQCCDRRSGKDFVAEITVTCCRSSQRNSCKMPLSLSNIHLEDQTLDNTCCLVHRRYAPWIGFLDGTEVQLYECCRLQFIIRHVEDGMISRVILMSIDLHDMPRSSKTIIRQSGYLHTLDGNDMQVHRDLVQMVQFGINRDDEGCISVEGKIRLVVPLIKSATTITAKHKSLQFPIGVEEYLELRTEMPDNPKYFVDVFKEQLYNESHHEQEALLR